MKPGPISWLHRGAPLLSLLALAACDPSRESASSPPASSGAVAMSRSAFLTLPSPPRLAPLQAASPSEEFSDCDPLAPDSCMLPFPNNFWLREDASTSSGARVQLGVDTMPMDLQGKGIDPTEWNTLDGFPPITAAMAYFGNVNLDNVPHHWDIARSLDDDSPTVLLDAETGERLPHFAELNESGKDNGRKAFMIWPIQSLENAHRYIVAVRDLTLENGAPVRPSEAFLALRDSTPTDDYDVEGRRATYEDIFARLEAAGVARESLQLAWDYTTASRENLTGRMLYARDDAFERMPFGGPDYRIDEIEDDYNDNIYRRIAGRYQVPLYVNSRFPGATLVLDGNGNPEYQGLAWARFEVLIPRSLVDNHQAGRILQYGHGLFGSLGEVESGYLGAEANKYDYVLCATDWWGMSTPDAVAVVAMMSTDFSDFKMIPDRSTQGMINALLLMKMMMGEFATDEVVTFDGVSTIDPNRRSYFGNSQGGILGGVYMAVTTDVEYGVLGVPGAPYGLLLPRSADFELYYAIIKARYPDDLDQMLLLTAMQMLWDRAEPSGYLNSVGTDPLPNTPEHRVILQYGLGDAQVSWLGAYVMGRSYGAVVHDPYVVNGDEILYGFDTVTGPVEQSVLLGYDYTSTGVPVAPNENLPPDKEYDTHEKPRREATAQDQMNYFFRTGIVDHYCGGACDPG